MSLIVCLFGFALGFFAIGFAVAARKYLRDLRRLQKTTEELSREQWNEIFRWADRCVELREENRNLRSGGGDA